MISQQTFKIHLFTIKGVASIEIRTQEKYETWSDLKALLRNEFGEQKAFEQTCHTYIYKSQSKI